MVTGEQYDEYKVKRILKLNKILLEIQHSVFPISSYDGNTPRYENTRKYKYYHNKKSNLWGLSYG